MSIKPREIRELEAYLGIKPFGVLVDKSKELDRLVDKAKKYKNLPFEEKLKKIKFLTVNAMENAYEGMFSHPDPRRREVMRDIVYYEHPLSYALKERAGCCRYQGVLFFILGFVSELGVKHFLRSAHVGGDIHTVFNDVYDERGKLYRINIFTESLKDKRYDYSNLNPNLYNEIDSFWPGLLFYSYHKRDKKIVLIESLDAHLTELEGEKFHRIKLNF